MSVKHDVTEKKLPGATVSLISGGIAGLLSAAILQPLDLLKTRLQQQQKHEIVRPTISKELRKLTQIKDLWRGVIPSTLRTSVGAGLYFTSLSTTRNYIAKLKNTDGTTDKNSTSILPKLSPVENLTTGFVCRAAVGFITMPITVIKTRYESNLYHYNSLYESIQGIYQDGASANRASPKNFFKGSIATLARDCPYAGLYVLFYEKCKHEVVPGVVLVTNIAPGDYPGLVNSASALLAASISTTTTAPFDAIKTRLQLTLKSSFVLATRELLSEQGGIRNLFRGLSLRLSRKGASAAISWCVYEELIKSNMAARLFASDNIKPLL
jgi:solute carrier family 25 protein 38